MINIYTILYLYILSIYAFQNTVDEYLMLIVMNDPSVYQWSVAKEGHTILPGGKHTEL